MENKEFYIKKNEIGISGWKKEWQFTDSGSLYAFEEYGQSRFLVGGSTWRRRVIPFSDEARNESGKLTLLSEQGSFGIREEKALIFPSMVNVVMPLSDGKVIAGCKYGNKAWNIVDKNFEVEQSVDDFAGGGIYNAFFDEESSSIVACNRNGSISLVDPESLQIEFSKFITNGSRLWSIAKTNKEEYVCGDYDGNLYAIDLSGNVKNILSSNTPEGVEERYSRCKPSFFGLCTDDERIIAGNRWGQIFWMDKNSHNVIDSKTIPYEITFLKSLGEELIIGTRQGKLLSLGKNGDLEDLLYVNPSLQTDNSIWSISDALDGGLLIGFADGQAVKMKNNFTQEKMNMASEKFNPLINDDRKKRLDTSPQFNFNSANNSNIALLFERHDDSLIVFAKEQAFDGRVIYRSALARSVDNAIYSLGIDIYAGYMGFLKSNKEREAK